MRTVLLDMLSCALAGHGPKHCSNHVLCPITTRPGAHYCHIHFTDQETEVASSQVTTPPGPSASVHHIRVQETRFRIPDRHHGFPVWS